MNSFDKRKNNLLQAIVVLFTGLILMSLYQVAVTGVAFWWLAMFLGVAIVLGAVNSLPTGHPLKFINGWC